jgi:hypothetical protein
MRWTRVVTLGAALAGLLALEGCGASGPPPRSGYSDGGEQTGGSQFSRDFAKITANSACENLPLEEIAEYLEYDAWGRKGQLNSEYTPSQAFQSYGKCQALNVVLGTVKDSRGRDASTEADLDVGVIPARTQEELSEDWATRVELVEKYQGYSGVEAKTNSSLAGPWDEGQLFLTDLETGYSIHAIVRGRSFVIEASIKLGTDQGANQAAKHNGNVAEAQHIPHTPAEITAWLEQQYLPQAHAKVMTIVDGS